MRHLATLMTLAIAGTGIATSAFAQKAELREAFCKSKVFSAEYIVCRDRNLTRLDAYMNEIYGNLRKLLRREDFRPVRQAQRQWIETRNQCGARYRCIENAYNARTEVLERIGEVERDVADSGPPSEHCTGETGYRSRNSARPTRITFHNRSRTAEDSYKIYWLDFKGRRKLYRTIYKGDTLRQATFMTHPWVVTSPIPGGGEICMGIYMPRPGGRVVTFD